VEGFIENLMNLFSRIGKHDQQKMEVTFAFSPRPDRSARGISSFGPIRDSFFQGLAPHPTIN
jgi:hypothetical protein